MKAVVHLLVITLTGSSLMLGTGCTTTGSNAESGMLAGALIGAVAGAVIGQNSEDGSNDFYQRGYYVRHRGHYYADWDDDNGGAEGALIGAAAGALIGGIIGSAQDERERKDAELRAEEMRLQRELALRRAEEEAAYRDYQTRLAVSQGMVISDDEVALAERRAQEAEARLQALRRERLEALRREQRYTDAETRRMEAEMEIERLEQELSGQSDSNSHGTAYGPGEGI